VGKAVISRRELEVIALVARGMTNDEIAGEMGISVETVKSHMRHLLAKLRAKNRTHAVGIVAMNAPHLLRDYGTIEESSGSAAAPGRA